MDVFAKLLLCLSTVIVLGESVFSTESDQVSPRYLVFPGVDAGLDEISEWSYGFASPFNLFFGPKPYVLGWMGEAPFGPIEEEGEEGEDWEGEEEEEEVEEGEEIDEENPEYDYEE